MRRSRSDAERLATATGQNRYGTRGVWLPEQEAVSLALNHHDALILPMFLRAKNGPNADFMVANGLAGTLRLPRRRLSAARQRLIDLGYIKQVRKASFHTPGLFHWAASRSARKTPPSFCGPIIRKPTIANQALDI